MYSLCTLTEISSPFSGYLTEKELVTQLENTLSVKNLGTNEEKTYCIGKKISASKIKKFGNEYFLVNGIDGALFAMESNRKEFKLVDTTPFNTYDIFFYRKVIAICYYHDELPTNPFSVETALFDFDENHFLWRHKGGGFKDFAFFNSTLLISKFDKSKPSCISILSSIDIESGNTNWLIDFSKAKSINETGCQITKILGIQQKFHAVYVILDNNSVAEIDYQNGSQLRSWEMLSDVYAWQSSPHQPPSTLIPGVNRCVLDPHSSTIVGLSSWFFWEIDLESGAITFHDLRETFEKNELHCSGPIALQGDHVFFLSDALLFRGAPWKVAALNRKTLEVDWFYEFPKGTRIHARGPQVQGNYLFVVDSKNTLHLFERT